MSSLVIADIGAAGHETVAASPNTGVNTLTGEGVAEALAEATVVVDMSNSPSFADDAVLDFFTTSTTNLLTAEHEAGVRHHVALSVVGTDRLAESGYFRAKIAQEKLIRESGAPFTIVHATQFFEFVRGIADASTVDGVVRLSPASIQPMAGDDVATALSRFTVETPRNATREIAGPQEFGLDELVRIGLASHGDTRDVITDDDAATSAPISRARSCYPATVPRSSRPTSGSGCSWTRGA